jgi:hypothetical protein
VQPTFYQIQPKWINLDSFFALIGNIIKWILSIHFFAFMYILTTLVIIALITLILFMLVRLSEIKKDKEKKKAMVAATIQPVAQAGVSTGNDTWHSIRERLLSNNDSDWKLAIIEADIYLDKILDNKGFHGDTTSDKLKQITPAILPSIVMAWEAHKVRNRIAHQGSSFVLTMPEARKVLSYFEMVFTDLGVI